MARITRRKYHRLVKAAARKIKPGQIIGYRVGGESADDSEHFYPCKECGQAVDKRDLGQVFGTILDLIDSTPGAYEKAAALLKFLSEQAALQKRISSFPQAGLNGMDEHLAETKPDDILLESLLQACRDIESLDAPDAILSRSPWSSPLARKPMKTSFRQSVASSTAKAHLLFLSEGRQRKLVEKVTYRGFSNPLYGRPRSLESWRPHL